MEHHMQIAGPAFLRLADVVELRSMDVYGQPSDALLDLIERKIEMLGNATVAVHEHHAGFLRYGSR
jgi:hypothetical protein